MWETRGHACRNRYRYSLSSHRKRDPAPYVLNFVGTHEYIQMPAVAEGPSEAVIWSSRWLRFHRQEIMVPHLQLLAPLDTNTRLWQRRGKNLGVNQQFTRELACALIGGGGCHEEDCLCRFLQENLQRHNGWRRQICVREGNVHSGHRARLRGLLDQRRPRRAASRQQTQRSSPAKNQPLQPANGSDCVASSSR